MISDVDGDGFGTIGYEEFRKMMMRKNRSHNREDEILKAFCLFHDDETSEISFKNSKRDCIVEFAEGMPGPTVDKQKTDMVS